MRVAIIIIIIIIFGLHRKVAASVEENDRLFSV